MKLKRTQTVYTEKERERRRKREENELPSKSLDQGGVHLSSYLYTRTNECRTWMYFTTITWIYSWISICSELLLECNFPRKWSVKSEKTFHKHDNDQYRPPPRSSYHPGPRTITLRVLTQLCHKLHLLSSKVVISGLTQPFREFDTVFCSPQYGRQSPVSLVFVFSTLIPDL